MVFVTGATGILGRVIVLELLKRGKKVRAAKRPSSDLEQVKNSFEFYAEDSPALFEAIDWVDIDFSNGKSVHNALKGCDEVYHCAAKVSYHPDDEREVLKTNLAMTKKLLRICENSEVQKFLYVSSAAIFDTCNSNGLIDEKSQFDPAKIHTAYAISKYKCEMEVRKAAKRGLNTIIINPGMIIGHSDSQKSSNELLNLFKKYCFVFPGTTGCVDVRDAARIAVSLMEKNLFGEQFIIVSENKRFAEISAQIRKVSGLQKPILISERWLKIGRIANGFLGFIFPLLRMLTKSNIHFLTSSKKYSNKKIKETLQYQFIGIDDSLTFHFSK